MSFIKNTYHTLALCLLLVVAARPLHAQDDPYKGGAGQGSSMHYLEQTLCMPAADSPNMLGGAGSGDSYEMLRNNNCILPQDYPLAQGGASAGTALDSLVFTDCNLPQDFPLCNGGEAAGSTLGIRKFQDCLIEIDYALAQGGRGAGYSLDTLMVTNCYDIDTLQAYYGGSGSGSAMGVDQNSVCTPVADVWSRGGSQDGFTGELLNCDPLLNPILHTYYGGTGAGSTMQQLTLTPCTRDDKVAFTGGFGDGYSTFMQVNTYCPPVVVTPPNWDFVFNGGGGDGSGADTLLVSVCTLPDDSTTAYGGGYAGGSDDSLIAALCAPIDDLGLWSGGSEDGQMMDSLDNSTCPHIDDLGLWAGGSEDGQVMHTLTQSSCPSIDDLGLWAGGTDDGAATSLLTLSVCTSEPDIYVGGRSDGASMDSLRNTFCTPNTDDPAYVYFGGTGDGGGFYQSDDGSMCGTRLAGLIIYRGGSSDGQSMHTLTTSACSAPDDTLLFAGGFGRGDNYQELLTAACVVVGGDEPEFGGGTDDGHAYHELLLASCVLPASTVPYLGGSSDGHAYQELVTAACVLAPNAVPFAGGISDGYAYRELVQSVCASIDDLGLFTGGANDGYAYRELVLSACAPINDMKLAGGGSGDGYAEARLQIECHPNSIFPIELENFMANAVGNEWVLSQWYTATEVNSAYFDVQRSWDGRTYEHVGQVPAAGNTTERQSYDLMDWEPYRGLSYYRLRMVDLDGSYRYSNVAEVYLGDVDPQAEPEALVKANVFPNPTTGIFYMGLSNLSTDQQGVAYSLFNGNGQLVDQGKVLAESGFSRHQLDISDKARGVYILRMAIPMTGGHVSYVHRRVIKL